MIALGAAASSFPAAAASLSRNPGRTDCVRGSGGDPASRAERARYGVGAGPSGQLTRSMS